ncbi:MAG: PASTA domain-containing protein [Actinobacteria bacterium]|uniref:Unannotated protein n=1 Tax=freshwater metagenome TaxID=449393 RepID=A0A6J6UEB1_9ZZZZ|nr:PASTA domain-containing protein [Actinomycetota bacterium]
MNKTRGLLPLVGALLIVASAVLLLGFSDSLNPLDAIRGLGRVVTVPDFAGRPLPRAKVEAENLGLRAVTRTAFSLTAPRGTIVGQKPAAGEKARSGDKIELVVSSGVNRTRMPAAVGRPIVEVTRELGDPGVPIKIVEVSNETVPNGIVVAQFPAAEVLVAQAGSVRLEVSSGPDSRPVPEVAGLSLEGAAFRLGKAGLSFGPLTQADDPAVVAGAVISSAPAQGTKVPKDTAVALTISNGPPPIPVPEVTNTQQSSATDVLKAAGFLVDVAGQLVVEGDPGVGNVFGQNPVAGTPYRPGQIVTIVVGQVPPPRRAATTTTTPGASSSSTTVKPATPTTKVGG